VDSLTTEASVGTTTATSPQLKAGARKILETLARHHPMRFTKAQVGTLTGFKITGGTFQTYWSVLKRAGYVQETNGEILVTQAGLDRAGVVPEQPATTDELVAMWGSRLKRGARDMLEAPRRPAPRRLPPRRARRPTRHDSHRRHLPDLPVHPAPQRPSRRRRQRRHASDSLFIGTP
jgi:hypothetical protein